MKDYKKILEGIVNIINTTEKSDIGFANICSYIGENCPELKESEDEMIRKEIINYFKCQSRDEPSRKVIHNIWISWLEKQGAERKQLYIRFGDIPSNEKSKIYRGEEEIGEENGVSVYPAFELNGNIVLGLTLPITRTTLYTQQHLLEYDNRPCYLVTGDYVGSGTDGEPLIRNISIIKRLDNYRIKEIENQGEQKPATIDIDKMVDDYANNKERGNEEFGKPVPCMIRAYRQGINDALRLSLNLEKQDEQQSTDNKEKLDVLNFIRKETCCGLAEANNALLELIKVLKEHPSPIMDKPRKLKIEWEEQQ